MNSRELNLQIMECQSILKKLALRFTTDPDDIQDLVQETLLRALKYVDQFFHNPRIISWLYVIMKNIYINSYRQRQHKMQFENFQMSSYQSMNYQEPFMESTVEGELAIKDINRAIDQISESYSSLFLQFVKGYKYTELSEMHGLPVGTIKSRIHKVRKRLQKTLAPSLAN